jgi:glycosyltransferase involved in cell wall biosynthesis
MKVLHVGNIANNAYNNAKFLRRKGVNADVLCRDYTHVMGQPEWEDAIFEGQVDEYTPNWNTVNLNGFQRPTWFLQDTLVKASRNRKQQFKGQFLIEHLLYQLPTLWSRVLRMYLECRRTQSRPAPRILDVVSHTYNRKRFEGWFEGYDLIQAYSTDPIDAWMFSKGRPYVAFEHGTMRDIPFENSARGRLLSLAYRQAGKVVITNPDVISAARRLGLKNFLFIPHPVDETKYRPLHTSLRGNLANRYQADLILFAPSRHNWDLKGNDLLLKAFARCTKAFPGKLLLILCDWGQEVARSKELIEMLGIGDCIVWTPPLNKMKLIGYYNAADVVLDQFIIGTFGTVTPEAMACGKPVLLHFDREVHEWCYGEMPPVVSARTENEIFSRLMELLGSSDRREAIGLASREWVTKYHGWELVADRQIEVYRELLQQ